MRRERWLSFAGVAALLVIVGAGHARAAADAPATRPSPRSRQPGVEVERDVVYGKAGDRPLKLDVYRPLQPAGDRPLPAIVFIHGGGWQHGDKSNGGGVGAFASSGHYVGFSVGYRLSGEATWPAQIHDCKAAVRWVRANAKAYNVDPDRIGVWGPSAGGHLSALLGTSGDVKELEGDNGTPGVSSRVRCVVDVCGPADFSNFRHAAVRALFGGRFEQRMDEAKAASPITHVSKDDPPFLILHGTEDKTVPVSQSEALAAAMKNAGVDVTFVPVTGAGHGIRTDEARQRIRLFFAKHLRGEPVEVPTGPIVEAATPQTSR